MTDKKVKGIQKCIQQKGNRDAKNNRDPGQTCCNINEQRSRCDSVQSQSTTGGRDGVVVRFSGAQESQVSYTFKKWVVNSLCQRETVNTLSPRDAGLREYARTGPMRTYGFPCCEVISLCSKMAANRFQVWPLVWGIWLLESRLFTFLSLR